MQVKFTDAYGTVETVLSEATEPVGSSTQIIEGGEGNDFLVGDELADSISTGGGDEVNHSGVSARHGLSPAMAP